MSQDKKPALNPKQRAFVSEYLKDHNAAAASVRAGYSKKNSNVVGPRLLAQVGVSAAIEAAMKAQEERTLVTADYVINGLKEVAERCMTREPVMIREGRDLVQKTERIACDCGDANCKGTMTVGVWEFDSMGANKALELLGKYKKLFTDKVDVSSNGQTIKALLLDD